MRKMILAMALFGGLIASATAQSAKPLFENNFEKAELDKVPDGFLVLDGSFAVKQADGNKFLELPGAPLDTYGVLFGPTEKDGVCVSVRINGTGVKRRFPTLAVGLNGVGGYKLQVSPGKKLIELYRGEEVKSSVPFEWQSGVWTVFRLQIRKVKEGEWKVEGKAWPQSGKEPATWLISHDEKEAPNAGRASIWGNPYSSTPIQFDDLLIVPAVK